MGGNDSLKGIAAKHNVIFIVYDWQLPSAPPMESREVSVPEMRSIGRKKKIYLLIDGQHYWALEKNEKTRILLPNISCITYF